MTNKNFLLCVKCSHLGQPLIKIQVIKGIGNKKVSVCAKCGHCLAVEDFVPNKAEESPDAPRLL